MGLLWHSMKRIKPLVKKGRSLVIVSSIVALSMDDGLRYGEGGPP